MPLDLNKFNTGGQGAIASYSYTDIASGTGYNVYYLIESEDSGGKDYHLTTQTDYSNSVSISSSANETLDYDYDLTPFALPQTIEGTALFSLPIHSTGGATINVTVEVYKWDGSTETKISDTVTYSPSLSGARMLYMPLTITKTHFKIGETLRLRLAVGYAGVTTWSYGIDPANRSDGTLTITTQSKIKIPFRIQL